MIKVEGLYEKKPGKSRCEQHSVGDRDGSSRGRTLIRDVTPIA